MASDADARRRLANLSPGERDALLELVRRRNVQTAPRGPAARPTGTEPPLTPSQARLWFLQQLEPSSVMYNNPCALRIRGPLDADVLARALTEIVRRHEVLRTRYPGVGGAPRACVDPPAPVALPTIVLDAPSAQGRDAGARRWIEAARREPFDLAAEPPLRAALLRLDADEHVLFLNLHHIACDAWSHRIVWRELLALYPAFLAGEPSPLPELAVQYGDVAAWQRDALEPGVLAAQWAYWERALGNAPAPLALAPAAPRAEPAFRRGATERTSLDAELVTRARACARAHGATFSTLLLTAFDVALSAATGETDLLIGAPVADRRRAETENLIGLFLNVLPLRVDLSDHPTLREAIARVGRVALDAMTHCDVPFDELVARFAVRADRDFAPLVRIAFVFDDVPAPVLALPSLSVEPLELDAAEAKLDLILTLTERSGALHAAFEYDADRISGEVVAHLAAGFRGALVAAIADPDQRLSAAPTDLTESQLQLWLSERLHPDVPLDNSVMTFAIEGTVDPVRFQRAFAAVVEATDALRTTICVDRGVPRMVVRAHSDDVAEIVDLRAEPAPRAAYERWLRERCTRQFNTARTLVDSVLVRVADDRTVWYLNLHHLVTDAWSTALIFRRTADAYAALARDEPRAQSYPAFAEYARADRELRASASGHRAARYWAERLAGDWGPRTLYGVEPRDDDSRAVRRSIALDAERTRALDAFAARAGLTALLPDLGRFLALATVLAAWLYRVGDARRISIGTPVHARFTPAQREVTGFCIDVWPLRIEVGDDETFLSLFGKVRAATLDALKHLPCAVPNRPDRRAYTVMLNYHTATFGTFAGMPTRTDWIQIGYAREAFTLQVHDFDGTGLPTLLFDLRDDVFGGARGDDAMAHFLRVLDACCGSGTRIDDVELPGDRERTALLDGLRAADAAAPPRDLVGRTEAQAARTPDATAVVCGPQTLTYSELDERANQVANALRAAGVTAGGLVGVVLPRGAELVVALLGTLKAGAAYIPFDAGDPPQRLRSMLADAGAAAILAQTASLGAWTGLRVPTLALDAPDGAVRSAPRVRIARDADPRAWVYAIFTSGSTGNPKCAAVRHDAFANLLDWYQREFGLGEHDRTLVMTSPSFDLTQKNVFAPLVTGGTVVLEPGTGFEPAGVLATIETHGITVLNCAPAAFGPVLERAARAGYRALESLRAVVFGGEPVPLAPLRAWLSAARGRTAVANTYGPTECSDVVAFHALCSSSDGDDAMPLGRPIQGVRLAVLDARARCVPAGVTGELHVGGVAVGDGYVNDPAATADRFRPDPWSASPGARLYRTGDLVRLRSDGLLDYVGRVDHQLKVRGRRVEPGEVAAALARHPAVRDAFVSAGAGALRESLVAYVVPHANAIPAPAELRAFLRARLPEAMIPAGFALVERLPLTPRGKVDRRALLAVDVVDLGGAARVAPRTPEEVGIAAVWADLLRLDVERIGVDERFFDLGGHSLLAMQVVARIRDAFGVDLPLRRFFETPTVAGIAAQLRAPGAPNDAQPVRTATASVPLSLNQQALWLAEQLDGASAAQNIVLALAIDGELSVAALQASLDAVILRHDALRAVFRAIDGRPHQVIQPHVAVVLKHAVPHGADEREREDDAARAVADERARPFDLTTGPLLRAMLLTIAPRRHVLAITFHHIVADGWSLTIVARELLACYRALLRGEPIALAPPALRYADYAHRQRRTLDDAALASSLNYWQRRLDGARPALRLPAPAEKPPIGAVALRRAFGIGGATAQALRALAQREGTTQFVTLLAAFKILLWHYSRDPDVIVGTDVAGRDAPELAGVVGCFVNQVALRTDLAGDPSFRATVARVRETVAGALAHAHVPFERVVALHDSARRDGRPLLFHAKFVFGELPQPLVELPDVRVAPFANPSGPARFDVLLHVRPDGDGCDAVLDVDPARVSPSIATHLADDYAALLEIVCTEPDAPLGAFRERLNARRRVGAGA